MKVQNRGMENYPHQDIAEFLSDRISFLEAKFEARFDKLEDRLDRWMEKNGKQNVSIQKNADKIDELRERINRKSKWLLTISVAIASCIAALLSAFIQILVKCIL